MKRKSYNIHAGSYVLDLGVETNVMGIINMTPDSFSKDGCWVDSTKALNKAQRLASQMIRDGAHILDIGGESSRPGSSRVTVEEERQRVIPLIKGLAKKVMVPISIDTYKPQVAQEALDAGASMINTIKGLNPDKSLLRMIRDYKAAIVLMHMRGTPKTMQKNVSHKDVVEEVIRELADSVRLCLDSGIASNQMIIDPGIGFGKTTEQNVEVLRHLHELTRLKCPILIGVSRKSFIGQILDQPVKHRVYGSLAAAGWAVSQGAHIVRAHDVFETVNTVKVMDAILNSKF